MANDPVTSLGTTPIQIGTLTGYSQATDYTLADVATQYKNTVKALEQLLHGTPTNAVPVPPAPTLGAADAATLSAQITILRNLLVNGITAPVDPANPGGLQKTYYLTSEMADQLRILIAALQQIGVVIPNNAATPVVMNIAQARTLQELSAATLILNNLFTSAATGSNRSIQSLVELDYVQTGNDLLSDQLSNLEKALDVTKTTLDYLGNLQELHNQIVVNNNPQSFLSTFDLFQHPGDRPFTPSGFFSAYAKAASAYFSTPIAPTTIPFPPSGYSILNVPGTGFDALNKVTTITDTFNHLMDDFAGIRGTTSVLGISASFIIAKKQADGDYIFYNGDTGAAIGSPPLRIFIDPTPNLGGFTQEEFAFINPGVSSPEFNALFSPSAAEPVSFQIRDSNGNLSGSTPTFPVRIIQQSIVGGGGTAAARVENLSTLYRVTKNLAPFYTTINGVNGITNTLGSPLVAQEVALLNAFYPMMAQLIPTLAPGPNNPANSQYFFQSLNARAGQQTWIGYFNTGVSAFHYRLPSATPADFIAFQKKLISTKATLEQQLALLSGSTPRINITAANPAGDEDPNSLLGRLRTVMADLNATLITAGGQAITSTTGIMSAVGGFRKWLMDDYQLRNTATSNQAGKYQQAITFAITAGQSQNDTEKEQVRRFLYVFEEYYKSASAILQKLTQILERMAQGIGR